ncbi:MAG: hypothetical protein JWN47_2912 [Frankiales bacterium]|nr:hypothetical protein [Frankiales bacterium]
MTTSSEYRQPERGQAERRALDRLDQLAGAALVRARPWDVIGAALAGPMLLWGFFGWFGTVGDAGGGVPGFFGGTGAAGISLVLAASALTLNLVLAGKAHTNSAPPVAVLLAGSAVIVILGGLVAKPDSSTIGAGAVAGLLTAISQATTLTIGWVKGSGKAVKAARVAALVAQQGAADQAGARRAARPQYGPGGYPQTQYPSATYPQAQYPQAQYPQAQYPQGEYPQQQYPPPPYGQQQYPPDQQSSGGYPQQYPPPGYYGGSAPGRG